MSETKLHAQHTLGPDLGPLPPEPRPCFSLAKPQRMCFWAYPPQASTGPAHLPHHLLAVLISQLPNPRLLDPSHVHTSATHPQPHLSPPLLCPTRSLALHSCCPPSAHTAVPSIVPLCAPTPPCPSSSALLGTACLCHHPKSGGGACLTHFPSRALLPSFCQRDTTSPQAPPCTPLPPSHAVNS